MYVFFMNPFSSSFFRLSLSSLLYLPSRCLPPHPFSSFFPLPPPSSQGFVQLVDKTYAVAYVLTTYKNIQVHSIPSVYPQYTLSIPSVYPQYTLSISSVYPQYILSISSVYPQYILSIPSVYPQYTLSIPSVYPQCTLSISSVYPQYILSIPSGT